MKTFFSCFMPVIMLLLLSCDKEDPILPVENNFIANISFLEVSSVQDVQEIQVTIQKSSPCQYVSETVKNVSGNIFNYDFILKGEENPCQAIYGITETVPVQFDPSGSGQYKLNFLINGKVFETRKIEVTASKEIEGDWIVVSFEDYETSTTITKNEANTWPEYNNGDITVNFSFTSDLEGEISGKNVTNTFQGDFRVGPNNKIAIANTYWTEMNEPEWGKMFHSIISAESYEVQGNWLIIYLNEGKAAIVLER